MFALRPDCKRCPSCGGELVDRPSGGTQHAQHPPLAERKFAG